MSPIHDFWPTHAVDTDSTDYDVQPWVHTMCQRQRTLRAKGHSTLICILLAGTWCRLTSIEDNFANSGEMGEDIHLFTWYASYFSYSNGSRLYCSNSSYCPKTWKMPEVQLLFIWLEDFDSIFYGSEVENGQLVQIYISTVNSWWCSTNGKYWALTILDELIHAWTPPQEA